MSRILILILILSSTTLSAQEKSKLQYGGMQHIGIRMESSQTQPYINLINGVRWENYFFGLGVSYDYAFNRWGWGSMPSTMPLYLTARRYFFKKKKFFVLAEGGLNIIAGNDWMTPQGEQNMQYWEKDLGYYASAGLGFKARIGQEVYYTVDLSYNYKQTEFDHHTIDFMEEWTVEKNLIEQQRILLRFGIELF